MSEHPHCQALLEDLSEYIDGEAAETICHEIERHLADCQDCRIMLDTLKRTITLYRSQETEEPLPTDVRNRLVRTLQLDDHLSDQPQDSNQEKH